MKKFLIILSILLITLAGIAVVTCPDRQAHKDAIMSVVNEKIGDELGAPQEGAEDVYGLLNGLAAVGSHIGGWLLESNLTVNNYFVYSVGTINIAGESHKVSVGVFGHVFTFSKEDIDKALKGFVW